MPTVSPSRILLIDDEPQVRHSINRLLKQAGYVVLTHDGGPGCSYEAARFVPDLVLVDVKMPFLSGDSLVSLLGESASITPPIILLYSGIDRDALEKMAKTCGLGPRTLPDRCSISAGAHANTLNPAGRDAPALEQSAERIGFGGTPKAS
jgi:CheY-like chemotaxis protein